MPDILMYTDNARLNEALRLKSLHLGKLTNILTAYTAINLGAITGPEFKALVQNPAAVIFDKMTDGQDVVIGGLKVNKTKALEILEKPVGYEAMYDLIIAYQNTVPNWSHYLSSIDIDLNEVVLAQSVIDAETEASKVYAVTDREKAAFEFAQGVIALAIDKFGVARPNIGILTQKLIHTEARPYNSNNIEYTIKAWDIKGLNMNL